MGELGPGTTDRRWIPEGGLQRHRERIHRESKFADDHKNLPFNFSKPPKSRGQAWFRCVECNREFSAPKNTIMCICPQCKKTTRAERLDE